MSVVNLSIIQHRKRAEELRQLKEKHKQFLTEHERAALGCAAHRSEAEARLIEGMSGGRSDRD
jgi:hypothetical protein